MKEFVGRRRECGGGIEVEGGKVGKSKTRTYLWVKKVRGTRIVPILFTN